jgi:hypothetical protein
MLTRSLLVAFAFLWLAVPAYANAPVPADNEEWLNVFDFQERQAFNVYGPPLEEDAAQFGEQTKLYLDMVEFFFVVSEDENDFDMVAEAFSVPVDVFRPSSFRPEGTIDDSLFADDPLPQQFKSTSYYVDTIRPSFVPGATFKAKSLSQVKLGDSSAPRSLFQDEKNPEEKPPEEPAKKDDKAGEETAQKDKDENIPAGKINAPKRPENFMPGSDEETLHALQQAIRELGLEKQLNFESNQHNTQRRMQMSDGKTPPEGEKPDGETPDAEKVNAEKPVEEMTSQELAKTGVKPVEGTNVPTAVAPPQEGEKKEVAPAASTPEKEEDKTKSAETPDEKATPVKTPETKEAKPAEKPVEVKKEVKKPVSALKKPGTVKKKKAEKPKKQKQKSAPVAPKIQSAPLAAPRSAAPVAPAPVKPSEIPDFDW